MTLVKEAIALILKDVESWKSKRLRFIGSVFEKDDFYALINLLKSIHKIKALEIRLCQFKQNDFFFDFCKELKNTSLEIIYLGNVNLGDSEASALATSIQECRVKKLNLCNNEIHQSGCQMIAFALVDCGLEYLNLSNNSVGEVGAKALANSMKTGSIVLKTLDLQNNNIGNGGAIAILEALEYCKLETLRLDGNNLTSEILPHLVRAMEFSKLTTISLSSNNFSDADSELLTNLLINNKVKELDFGNTNLGNDSLLALSKGLSESLTIETLDFEGNENMSDEAVLKLIDNVKTHYSLKTIRLPSSISSVVEQKLTKLLTILRSERALIMTILCSPYAISRLGGSKIQMLPHDLIRLVSTML